LTDDENFIVDPKRGIFRHGEYSGAILIKPHYPFEAIILVDNLKFEEKVEAKEGLLIGVHGEEAIAREINFEAAPPYHSLDYAVQISPEIIEMFDQGVLSSSFPYTISFLHTALLWNQQTEQHTVDHLDFVRGEILSRPVACDVDGGIIIGDRLVINQTGDPLFYNTFIVSRNEKVRAGVSYDPMYTIGERFLKFIVILGSENLKKALPT